MKATDFDLPRDLKFSFAEGMTTFGQSRLLIFEAGSIGLLRQTILDLVGPQKAHEVLFRFGFKSGYADFLQLKLSHDFDTEMDLLASGPVIHTWEGIVSANPTSIEFDRATGEFAFEGVWKNSYEAEQYLCFNEVAGEPVCWTLTGYASGWCSAFWGKPLLAVEPLCVGKGDPTCAWDIRPPDKHESGHREAASLVLSILMGQ